MTDAPLGLAETDQFGPAEHWILDREPAVDGSRSRRRTRTSSSAEAARLLYDAIWSDYCDWYLELAKIGLNEQGAAGDEAKAARNRAIWSTLSWVLDRYLRLLHPIMPLVTEEIWGRLPHLATDPELLVVARWPATSDGKVTVDAHMSAGVADLIDLVTAMRAARAESGIEASDWLPALIWLPQGPARDAYAALEAALAKLARVKPTLVETRAALDVDGAAGVAVISATGEARLLRSSADREREHGRLEKELRAVESQLAAAETRLSDHSFVTRAPENVVQHARRRSVELREQAEALRARMQEA